VCAAYLIGKRLFSVSTGALAALFLALMPLDILFSTQVGPETLLSGFLGLTVYCFIVAEQRLSMRYAMLAGLFFGISYLVKSNCVLVLPVFACFGFGVFIKGRLGLLEYLKQHSKFYLAMLFVFGLVFLFQASHFYQTNGVWFYGEQVRSHTMTHDQNSNGDYTWYPKVMLNLGANNFSWLHFQPFFGYIFWFVILATLCLLIARDKWALSLSVWWLFVFWFFQYGLQFFCTRVMDYCLYVRHPRFMTMLLIPSFVLLSRGFNRWALRGGWKLLGFGLIGLLSLSSLIFAAQSSAFVRGGMDNMRLPAKEILARGLEDGEFVYLRNSWLISKFKVFWGYEDTLVSRIRLFGCSHNNCSSDYTSSGEFLQKGYILLDADPYSVINAHEKPAFARQVPDSWELAEEFRLKNRGIFQGKVSRLYYVR
jgi:4-amino-4-deoxy-L-arabinose transferase-like glycosyltransferase